MTATSLAEEDMEGMILEGLGAGDQGLGAKRLALASQP
jgi:hypothetical protein